MTQSRTIGRVHSVRVGGPQTLPDPFQPGKTWRSSFRRHEVTGPVALDERRLEGDEVADKKYHGRPSQAMLLFALPHYEQWRAEFDLPAMMPGGFGENLTITDVTENDVCLGDHLQIGTAVVEITAPRVPCSKIDRNFGHKGITARVAETARGGWYVRVIQPGTLQAGEEVALVKRVAPDVTVVDCARAWYGPAPFEAEAERALASDVLLPEVREAIEQRLGKTTSAGG